MADQVSQLIIKIMGDAKDFKGSLIDATASTEEFNTSLLGIAAVAAGAFAVVAEGVKYSIEKYAESEQATNTLTLAMQNQGIYSDYLFNSYRQQAEELQHLTGIDQDAIVKGQAKLQSMIGQTEITKEMTAAAVNLGAALGGDVNTGFEILGRSIDGQTRGLKQLGIEVDQNLTRDERTKQILDKVSVAYGGLAEAQNKGLGSVKGLSTSIAELAKDFGQQLAPSVASAEGWLTRFFQRLHSENVRENNPIVQIDEQVEHLRQGLENINKGGTYIDLKSGKVIADAKQIESEIAVLQARRDELMRGAGSRGIGQSEEQKKAAAAAEAVRVDKEQRERNALLSHNAALSAATENHTKEVIGIYKEEASIEAEIADDKNKRIRDGLEGHLEIIKRIRKEAQSQEVQQGEIFNETLKGMDEERFQLTTGQMIEFNEQERQQLISKIETEDTIKRKALNDELSKQITAHNTFLLEQNKYGRSYAALNKLMHSEIYDGTKTAFGDLAALQNSSNSTLKAIGKFAAMANIVIKTAESAMNIYAGFSTIPIIGPTLGIAGAAAAIAYGAEQEANVMAAAQGGLITGGVAGIDSVPVLAQRGELISPPENFEEVIGSVRAAREAENYGQGGQGGMMQVVIGFKDSAFEIIEQKLLERRSIGTGSL